MNVKQVHKKVHWKDLIRLSGWEIFVENNITLPWLAGSLILAYFELYWWALPVSSIFFLTGLRQVHNGFHNSLGTNKWLTNWCLFANSILMMTSIHAVKHAHLRHHKYCMGEQDIEGQAGRMKWWRAILHGPIHIFLIHKSCWQHGGNRYRQWMAAEWAAILIYACIALYFDINWMIYHMVAMFTGELLSAFFAVWTVHHDIEPEVIARTQRTRWKNAITFNMFYHLEHHLFPAVPTIKLPELAKRMDEAMPEVEYYTTF